MNDHHQMCNFYILHQDMYLEDHPIGALTNLLNLVEVFQPVACLAWGHPFSRDFLWSTKLDWFLLLYKICLLIYWSRVPITFTLARIHGRMDRLPIDTKRIVSRERGIFVDFLFKQLYVLCIEISKSEWDLKGMVWYFVQAFKEWISCGHIQYMYGLLDAEPKR